MIALFHSIKLYFILFWILLDTILNLIKPVVTRLPKTNYFKNNFFNLMFFFNNLGNFVVNFRKIITEFIEILFQLIYMFFLCLVIFNEFFNLFCLVYSLCKAINTFKAIWKFLSLFCNFWLWNIGYIKLIVCINLQLYLNIQPLQISHLFPIFIILFNKYFDLTFNLVYFWVFRPQFCN